MLTRVSEQALEFNKSFIREMTETPQTNGAHLQLAQRALRDALEYELTPRQRQLVLMHFYEQYTVGQIAGKLELDKSTVSRTLSRAKQRLRRSLRVYFDYTNYCLTEES